MNSIWSLPRSARSSKGLANADVADQHRDAARPRPGRLIIGGGARSVMFLREIIIARHRMPMRRRDLAWFAVFPDPVGRLNRPVSDVVALTRIILENEDLPVLRCTLDRVAHRKDAPSDTMAPSLFRKTSAIRGLYSIRGRASRHSFWRVGEPRCCFRASAGCRSSISSTSGTVI